MDRIPARNAVALIVPLADSLLESRPYLKPRFTLPVNSWTHRKLNISGLVAASRHSHLHRSTATIMNDMHHHETIQTLDRPPERLTSSALDFKLRM
jgi:hypothetical protein